MVFIFGMLCGAVLAVAMRSVLLEWLPLSGVEKPETPPQPPRRKQWTQTHNFLYYDGSVMPEIKEDDNEQ